MSSAYRFPGGDGFAHGSGYYKTSNGRRRRSILKEEDDISTLKEKVKRLARHVRELKSPLGNKENPARSCLDLFHCGKKVKDGWCLEIDIVA